MKSSAADLFKEAQKKKKGTWGLFADYGSAEELFCKSGAQYKLQSDYLRAGEAYVEAAECARKDKNDFRVAENYEEASKMFLLASSPKYETVLESAVQSMLNINRLSKAADTLRKAGVSFCEKGMTEKALACYKRAENYYFADSQPNQCDKCKILRADIYSEQKEYDNAMLIYEELAKSLLSGPLKFEAQKLHMKAMLCQLALIYSENRVIASMDAEEKLEIYLQMNSYLMGSREEEILRMLLEAVKNQDEDKFTEALLLVQQLKMLDDWMTSVLLVIKENMTVSIL